MPGLKMLKSLQVVKCQLLPVMTVTTVKDTPLTKVHMDTKLPTYRQQCVTSSVSPVTAEASYLAKGSLSSSRWHHKH